MFDDSQVTDPAHEGPRASHVDAGAGYDGKIVTADDARAI
jgi:hypothetical protein